MKIRSFSRSLFLAYSSLVTAFGNPAAPPSPVVVTVDPGTTFATYNYNIVLPPPIYQSIANSPNWPVVRGPYLKQLVNQLGINTLDLGIFPGDIENNNDWFTPLNIASNNGLQYRTYRNAPVKDGADINHFNCADATLVKCPTSFPLAENDWLMDNYWIGPEGMRSLIAARGETPHLILSVQNPAAGNFMATSPDEFAKAVAALFIHDQNKYGLVPDIIQTVNEPDGSNAWTASTIAASMKVTKARLASLGFRPQFWQSTGSSAGSAVTWYKNIKALTGPGQIDALSWHNYGGDSALIASTSAAEGIPNVMTEYDAANFGTLFGLVKNANISGFMRFTDGSEDAWSPPGTCQYLHVTSASPYASLYMLGNEDSFCATSEPLYFFPQFSKYIGQGNLREQATITNGGTLNYDAVAFRNQNGQHSVIVRVMASAAKLASSNISNTVNVTGIPAGTYGCTYTFDNSTLLAPCGPNQTIGAGDALSVTLPYPAATRGVTTAVVTFFEIRTYVPGQLAVYRSLPNGPGIWALDTNRNSGFDSEDTFRSFGLFEDRPVTGDWDGTGVARIAVFRNGLWYMDMNNNGQWDGTEGGDAIYSFGMPGDLPVAGDWNGDGRTKLGILRCPPAGKGSCTWVLDYAGKFAFDSDTARIYSYGIPGDLPVASNWSGTSNVSQIGVFRDGTWIVDSNGDGVWQPTDAQFFFGMKGDLPVVGAWNTGSSNHIGVYRNGIWILDTNGNNGYDATDFVALFGLPGDLPLSGLLR